MKFIKIVFITTAVVSAFSLISCQHEETEKDEAIETARPAKIVPVVTTGVTAQRSYPGTLEASRKAELAFRVGGQLSALPAQAGAQVKKGALLARLDETDYQNVVEQHTARFELATIQYNQARKMLEKKLISRLQFDQASAELKSAKAALDGAKDNLRYTKLKAPFDGIVARVDVENFQAIQPRSPVITLQAANGLDVKFSVPESLITQLKRVEDPKVIDAICGGVTFAGHAGQTYKACHKEHESVPDALTRNYQVVFNLEKITDFAALPGMSATIEIDFSAFLQESHSNSLLVPTEAVFEQDNSQWVWRVNSEMRAEKVSVKVGQFENAQLEITKGLLPKDHIIAAGVSYVREGMLVTPLVKERGL